MSKIIQIALLAFIATSVVSAAPLEKRQSCASVWGQCGGQGWTGPTTCCSGSVCTVGNPYYSQCIPGSSNPTTTTNPPPATTTTTKVATQTSPASSPSPNPGTGSGSVTLGTNWKWSSSNALVGPKLAPGRNTVPYAIKDPSVVFYNGVYHVYASTVNSGGYNLVYLNFTSFENSGNSPHFYMDQLPGWSGYKAAPQLFYFSPQKLWYLIWQSPNPTYSTNSNPGPTGWSSPRQMISSQPSNVPASWIDFFNICDDSRCYLFFSNDNGQWFQTSTAKSSFPNGWGGVTKILDSGVNRIYFEASMIYKVKNGGGNAKYFAAIESGNPSWTRYFHSFTAPSLAGPWTPLTASGEGGFNQPFAGQNNVVWPSAWTRDVSHGELIRTGYDEYIEADFCNLKFLYQGMAPGSSGDYNALPWKLGLLTATSKPSGC